MGGWRGGGWGRGFMGRGSECSILGWIGLVENGAYRSSFERMRGTVWAVVEMERGQRWL